MSTLHSGSSNSMAEKIRGNTCIGSQILYGASFALTFYTSCITVSFQRKPARTGFSVVASCTISSKSTVSRIAQRLTFFSCETTARNKATFFITSTVSVLTATSLNTSHQRISLKSRWTCTDWSVIIYFTNCSRSTSCCQAWIYTFL